MEKAPLFTEKQYLGRDPHNLALRLLIAIFCFVVYVWQEKQGNPETQLFLVAGIVVVIISLALLFMVHFSTTVTNDTIELDGLWTTRKVKIDLKRIVSVEETMYSRFLINNPVYNLHRRGSIRFYAGGKTAVTLVDREGLRYVIGTHRAHELTQILQPLTHDAL